jgi:hypothetical protein
MDQHILPPSPDETTIPVFSLEWLTRFDIFLSLYQETLCEFELLLEQLNDRD